MEAIKVASLVIGIVTVVLGLLGNTLVITATAKFKHLRKVTFALLSALAAYDIVLSTIYNPLSLVHSSEHSSFTRLTLLTVWMEWVDQCDIVQGLLTFANAGHVLCMLAVSLDRIFFLFSSNKHNVFVNKVSGIVILGLILAFSVIYPVVALITSPRVPIPLPCWSSLRIKSSLNEIVWIPTLAVTLTSFLALFVTFGIKRILNGPNVAMKSNESTTTSQNANQWSSDFQVILASMLSIIIFIPTYLTVFIIMYQSGENPRRYPTWVFHVCAWLTNLYSFANPIIYIMFCKDFRMAFLHIIKCQFSSSAVHPSE